MARASEGNTFLERAPAALAPDSNPTSQSGAAMGKMEQLPGLKRLTRENETCRGPPKREVLSWMSYRCGGQMDAGI